MMITELSVSNFRHIERLTVSPLGRVTLIGGRNGAGKTALLEALWLFSGADRPGLAVSVDDFRGVVRSDPNSVPGVFRNFDARQPVEVSANISPNGARGVLKMEAVENKLVTVRSDQSGLSGLSETEGGVQIVNTFENGDGKEYVSRASHVLQTLGPALPGSVPLAAASGIREEQARIPNKISAKLMTARNREATESVSASFGNLQLSGKERRVTDFLKHLEPALTMLTAISTGGPPIVHAYIGDNLPIPANLVGEGFSRMLELAVGVAQVEGGLLLVDEIENGLHYSAHKGIFSTLFDLAVEFDVQIVATTHSRECVIAARKALGGKGADDFAYHRIYRHKGEARVASFDSEMIDVAAEFDMEIR